MAELKSYEEAAKADTGGMADKFLVEVSLLVNTIYKLCKLDHLLKAEGYYEHGEFKQEHKHENAEPIHNMFEA